MTNFERICQLREYELAMVILNIAELFLNDDLCWKVCPRYEEDRCNDDCNNGLTEWLVKEYDPASPVYRKC